MKQSNVPTMASAIEESNIVLSEKPWRRTSIGCLVNNWFMITTIVSVISGFIVGFCIQRIGLSESGKTWLAMPGTIYIRLLKLTILPMITANVINVMANLNPKENEKVSGVALGFILIFNLLCSLIGIAYAYIIKPGNWAQSNSTKAASSFGSETGESGSLISCIFKDLLLNICPDNIVGVTLFQAATDYDNPSKNENKEITYPSKTVEGTNMIGVLFCSLAFGIAANASKEKGKAFKQFFSSLGDVNMLLMQKFLLITPLGVMFMVMSSIAEMGDTTNTFISLGFFVLINVVGQLTHFIFMLLSLALLCKNPFIILKYAFSTYFIAFATTSAVVSIPNAFVACDAYGIPKPISRFVLPFAATMKSDASAVFITASCLFIAQQQNIELDAAKVVTVVALSVAYVTALPNIPSASVVAVITVLESIGVNAEAVSLLYAVEWINDRLRAGNVALSHLYCTAFTFHAVEGGLKGAVGLESEI
ncbi:neutral amino acid transporter A [Echinococcus multilocularis]|uniref:Amino acid transporter n=1 Tax=Echinococcus multilocularis TaxID=6211 RepID=A0A068Y0T2_ECHMU|nr:neutral amino acid transporter A [Echinococcus multilocularis]